ncbi:MAG: thiamine pyrophosphate-binding protein, partial [Halobacteriovoraceae bacterium]|nr:thiamine pyrophosphate-binding protein [Halobacteriovoraceae bacterium]
MSSLFKNPSQLWSALIIDQMVKSGFNDFFCCPGMRNAPLLYATQINISAHIHQGFDERAQSYHALGFIKTTQKPAVLICTSGTAVANFLPAVIEAQKNHLPLVVLSADRPGELNATDANQTINQIEVLRNYTKSFWNTSEPQETYPPAALAGKISFLLNQSKEAPAGPLHINIPLREPLDHSEVEMDLNWRKEIESILLKKDPSLSFAPITKRVADEDIQRLYQKIKESKKPLIVFGPLYGTQSYDLEKVKEFIQGYQGSFSCDVTSSLKFSFGADNGLIPTLDHPEVLNQLEQ